jgi:hypothetical protein
MYTKIYFELGENVDNAATESLWLRIDGDNTGVLKNAPVHVKGAHFA